jgi:hypothetical protein
MADFLGGIGSLFTGSGMQEAELARQAELNKAYEQYGQLAGQGREALTSNYTSALQPWTGLQGYGTGGTQAYAAATGALGPEAMEGAFANFRTSPGYRFMVDEALNAVQRGGAAQGTATGNVLQAMGDRAAGLAGQEWGNYVNRLAPWLGYGQNIAGGLSNIYTGLGQGLAGSFGQQGAQRMNLGQQLGQSAYNYEFAPTVAAQNTLKLGLDAAKAAASIAAGMPPMMGGGGSFGDGASGYFGGSPETNPNLRPYA